MRTRATPMLHLSPAARRHPRLRLHPLWRLAVLPLAMGASAAAQSSPTLEALRLEAAELAPLVETDAVREWLDATSRLTTITPRSIFSRVEPRAVLSAADFAALPEAEQAAFTERPVTDATYYQTNYGTPLCYARALDLAALAGGHDSFGGLRILDYGYGQMGQVRLLAACGAEVVGVDPAAGLGARYSLPEDQGPYPPGGTPPRGSVAIVTGLWPGDPEVAAAVGTGFDIMIARNVLKHGYVHPMVEVPAFARIDLSCSDEEFLASMLEAIKPGGVCVIYNLGGPRLRNGAYDASADINCPWTREALEAAGFEVVAFDMDDSGPARQHAVVFGWGAATDPLGSDWFSLYTLVRRPPSPL